MGKLNELQLPTHSRRKRKTKAMKSKDTEMNLTTEDWDKRQKRRTGYRDPSVIHRTLTNAISSKKRPTIGKNRKFTSTIEMKKGEPDCALNENIDNPCDASKRENIDNPCDASKRKNIDNPCNSFKRKNMDNSCDASKRENIYNPFDASKTKNMGNPRDASKRDEESEGMCGKKKVLPVTCVLSDDKKLSSSETSIQKLPFERDEMVEGKTLTKKTATVRNILSNDKGISISKTVKFTRSVLINSDDVEQATLALKPLVPHLQGLESCGLGAYGRKLSMPRFTAVPKGGKFCQIMHVPNHWICVSNVNAITSNEVFVYDSLPSGTLPDEAFVQLTAMLRLWEDSDAIMIRIRNAAIQPFGTLSCGYYAIAAAVAICQGNEPTLWRYNHNALIEFIKNGIKNRKFEQLEPLVIVNEEVDLSVYREHKRHCLCQNKSNGSMIQCNKCASWYHISCVTSTKKQRLNQSSLWFGPCCKHLGSKAMKR